MEERGSKDRLMLEYIYGQKMDEPMIMPMMMEAEMMMEDMEFDAMPRMEMARGAMFDDAMPKMEMARAKRMPAPAPMPLPRPKPEKPEEEPIPEEDSSTDPNKGDMDFMKRIKQNTRSYNHILRKGYDKFNRVDFTKTLAFKSA
jgi:hypothetical protein